MIFILTGLVMNIELGLCSLERKRASSLRGLMLISFIRIGFSLGFFELNLRMHFCKFNSEYILFNEKYLFRLE